MAVGAPGHAELDIVWNLHASGLAANSAGRPARAAGHLKRALRMLAHLPAADLDDLNAQRAFVQARVLLTLAKSEADLHGFAKGMTRLAEADAVASTFHDDEIRTAIHNQRGLMLSRAGRDEEALAEFNAAELWFACAPPLEQCNVLLNRGALRLDRIELSEARADLTRCNTLAQTHGLGLLAAMANHNLGYLEFLAGNLPKALQRIDGGGEITVGMPRAAVLLDRARVLSEAGLTREADLTLAEARDLSRADRLRQEYAEIEFELATSAFLADNLPEARSHAVTARDRFRRTRNERWHRRAELLLLHVDLRRGRAPRRIGTLAIALADRFAASSQVSEERVARFIAAEAQLDSGQSEEALATAMVVGPAPTSDPIAVRLHTRYLRARLALSSDRRNLAAGEVRRGLDDLADYQAHFGSVDLQTASAVHGRQLAELGLRIATDTGRPAAVFAAIERGRASSSRIPAVRPARDAHSAALLTELRQTVEAQRAVATTSSEGDRLQRRRSSLERRISARGWSLPGAGKAEEPVDLSVIEADLATWDSALVSYYVIGGELRALIVNGADSTMVGLGAYSRVEEVIRRVRADFDLLAYRTLAPGVRRSAYGSAGRALDVLDALLVRPLGLDGRRIVLTPTAMLAAVPWSVLPSRSGVPTSVSRSATSWLRGVTGDRTAPTRIDLIVGPDLDRAEDEVRTVQKIWSDAATRLPSSREAMQNAFTTADVVHVAAHGRHEVQNPLFSSLRLGDGLLFAYELDRSERAPEHVVLSACDLGLATVRPGDEALGLTSVLLQLGSRSVVSGIARVADDVAELAMVGYHTHLHSGLDSALAIAEAVRELTEQHGVLAPFVCFGSQWNARSLPERAGVTSSSERR